MCRAIHRTSSDPVQAAADLTQPCVEIRAASCSRNHTQCARLCAKRQPGYKQCITSNPAQAPTRLLSWFGRVGYADVSCVKGSVTRPNKTREFRDFKPALTLSFDLMCLQLSSSRHLSCLAFIFMRIRPFTSALTSSARFSTEQPLHPRVFPITAALRAVVGKPANQRFARCVQICCRICAPGRASHPRCAQRHLKAFTEADVRRSPARPDPAVWWPLPWGTHLLHR